VRETARFGLNLGDSLLIWRVAMDACCLQVIPFTVLFVVFCILVVFVSRRMLMTAAVVMKRTNQRVPVLGSIKKIPNQEKS